MHVTSLYTASIVIMFMCRCIKYSVLIIGQWNTKSGFVQVLHVFRVPYRPSNSYSSRWLYILTNMRKFHELITLSCFTTKSLSNETVFTGKVIIIMYN